MKKLRNIALASLVFASVFSYVSTAAQVLAQANPGESLKGEAKEAIDDAGASSSASLGDVITDIVNALIFIVGSISVIMIVIGGIRYVLSGGDANATQSAKDTILYALVGVAVALFAYTLVNFVINNL